MTYQVCFVHVENGIEPPDVFATDLNDAIRSADVLAQLEQACFAVIEASDQRMIYVTELYDCMEIPNAN